MLAGENPTRTRPRPRRRLGGVLGPAPDPAAALAASWTRPRPCRRLGGRAAPDPAAALAAPGGCFSGRLLMFFQMPRRQDLRPLGRDGDRVLEMRRKGAVL